MSQKCDCRSRVLSTTDESPSLPRSLCFDELPHKQSVLRGFLVIILESYLNYTQKKAGVLRRTPASSVFCVLVYSSISSGRGRSISTYEQ